MDIPTPDSITIYPRTGEGVYGPSFGAGASSQACVQAVTTRTIGADGEEVLSDLLVILPPGVSADVSGALEYAGRWFDVLTVERLKLGAVEHHVELLCKSRANEVSAAPHPHPEPVSFTIVFAQGEGTAVMRFDSPVVFVDNPDGEWPEVEFDVGAGWQPSRATVLAGEVFFEVEKDDGQGGLEWGAVWQGALWRVLTQPAKVVTALDVPGSGTVAP